MEGLMKNSKTVRERLVGKPLIGFKTAAPCAPRAMVGQVVEVKRAS
jgi:hypothetical protein